MSCSIYQKGCRFNFKHLPPNRSVLKFPSGSIVYDALREVARCVKILKLNIFNILTSYYYYYNKWAVYNQSHVLSMFVTFAVLSLLSTCIAMQYLLYIHFICYVKFATLSLLHLLHLLRYFFYDTFSTLFLLRYNCYNKFATLRLLR